MDLRKNLLIYILIFIPVLFLLSGNPLLGKTEEPKDSPVRISILTYIYLGETDNDFFITCRIEKGEVVPDMLLDAVSKTGKRFSVKIDKIEKYLFTDEFIPTAKTGDTVCLQAKLYSGNAMGFNHEEYVLVNTDAPYFDLIKK